MQENTDCRSIVQRIGLPELGRPMARGERHKLHGKQPLGKARGLGEQAENVTLRLARVARARLRVTVEMLQPFAHSQSVLGQGLEDTLQANPLLWRSGAPYLQVWSDQLLLSVVHVNLVALLKRLNRSQRTSYHFGTPSGLTGRFPVVSSTARCASH